MSTPNYIKALKCRQCGKEYPPIKIHVCEECFGPLDVVYNLDAIELDKNSFKNRSSSLWRYKELLPIQNETNIVDLGAGITILHKCKRLGETLGLKKLYIKDDTVNPTGYFKDRPATVGVSKAVELG